jgi:hypothetical protein
MNEQQLHRFDGGSWSITLLLIPKLATTSALLLFIGIRSAAAVRPPSQCQASLLSELLPDETVRLLKSVQKWVNPATHIKRAPQQKKPVVSGRFC